MNRRLLVFLALAVCLSALAPSSDVRGKGQVASTLSGLIVGSEGSLEASERTAAPTPTGVGGYTESVADFAFGVEATGRIHMLWTGQLNSYFDTFAFYSSSTDGVNWSPYQIVNYYGAFDPQVVVDDVRHRVHLMYRSNEDGIIHHTVSNGVVSAPSVVDAGGVVRPKIAVDTTTGYAYAVWQQGYLYRVDETSQQWRLRTWYSYWNGSSWTPRIRVVNSDDTWSPSIAVAPGGRVMIAWFQNWVQSQGGPTSPGTATIPRTAYAADGVSFRVRQAVSTGYPAPQTDDLILLAYSLTDDRFYMLTKHLMWPGHSIVYRYAWNGTWSSPLNVSQNPLDWAVPVYLGASPGAAATSYAYSDTGMKARTETSGVLSSAEDVDAWLAARGYVAAGLRFFLDGSGVMHLGVSGTKDGAPGLYYVRKG